MTLAYNGYAYEDASSQLQARLNEPQTAQALNQILDKVELIAFTVTALDGLLQRGDKIADEAARSVADLKNSAPSELSIILQLLPQLVEMLPQIMGFLPQLLMLVNSPEFQKLLDVLSNPKTLEAIIVLMENMDKVAFSVQAIDGFLQRGDVIIESVAASVKDASGALETEKIGSLVQALPQLADATPQLIEALPQLVDATPQLLEAMGQLLPVLASEPIQQFITSGALEQLLNSGILAPQTIDVVGNAGGALVESYNTAQKQDTKIGVFGLLGALRDPDVQKALGFAVEFGKRFGKEI